MERVFSGWHFMNPIQWLKAVYETFGTPHPRGSLIAVTILGAIFFAAIWLFAANQVNKDHQTPIAPPSATGPATTSGDSSPAITGSGNSVTYGQSAHPEMNQKPPK
jgi:hypothetical protein